MEPIAERDLKNILNEIAGAAGKAQRQIKRRRYPYAARLIADEMAYNVKGAVAIVDRYIKPVV